jgi:hypothetical protein
MEPSGQYASGQVCNGSSLPGALKWKLELRRTASWGQGTPQLTPADTSGGCSPSHESVTVPGEGATGAEPGPRVCAAAASRLPSASVQVVIAAPAKAASFKNSRRDVPLKEDLLATLRCFDRLDIDQTTPNSTQRASQPQPTGDRTTNFVDRTMASLYLGKCSNQLLC